MHIEKNNLIYNGKIICFGITIVKKKKNNKN